jgi:transcriptional regulator with XRE-family HTH domain
MNIGNNIRQIRELKNFSQEYMANEFDLSQASYSKIENSQVTPKIDSLEQIADCQNFGSRFIYIAEQFKHF